MPLRALLTRWAAGSFLCALAGCSVAASDATTSESDIHQAASCTDSACSPVIIASFETPSSAGLGPVIDAINGAHTSIQMVMFHLTVQSVADALISAAKRGVNVELIIDQGNWFQHTTSALKSQLAEGGVHVTPSSTAFRITHEKSFVVDGATAYVMSLNLTSPYVSTRDYAVVTKDPGIVKDFETLFEADLENAKNGTKTTPALASPYLAVSPINSQSRLADLVNSAKSTIIASSENLGDPSIQAAMVAAAARGVNVRVLAPQCDQNVVPTYDLPFLAQLGSKGVIARALPGPATASLPYEHAKMIVVDDTRAYIGSINLSTASTTDARELGILFADPGAVAMISEAFESDWAQGVTPPTAASVTCPSAAAAAEP